MKVLNTALVGFLLTLTTATSAQRGADSDVVAHGSATDPGGAKLERWLRTGLTLSFDPSLAALGPHTEQAIQTALGTWQDTGARLPAVHFSRGAGAPVSLEADGLNTISFAPIDVEGHENDLAITITFTNPSTGEISEADVVINSRHDFSFLTASTAIVGAASDTGEVEAAESCTGSLDPDICAGRYDLENVLTHEFGHFFGLGEDFDDPRATMFSCTSACEIHKRHLGPNDVAKILAAYADQPIEVAGCQPASWGGRGRLGDFRSESRLVLWSSCLIVALCLRRKSRASAAQDERSN